MKVIANGMVKGSFVLDERRSEITKFDKLHLEGLMLESFETGSISSVKQLGPNSIMFETNDGHYEIIIERTKELKSNLMITLFSSIMFGGRQFRALDSANIFSDMKTEWGFSF